MMDRAQNPSPPPELKGEELFEDRVGKTVFSKHWLFQILMNAIQAVEKEAQGESPGSSVVELAKDVEEELCLLWDMSVDGDVAHFLYEFKAVDIFLGVIERTRSPRLTEISVGILGNMMAFSDICVAVTGNEAFVHTFPNLLGLSDALTLIQVVRALRCCVVNKETGNTWIQHIKESSATNYVQFILQNSLNVDLLQATLQLVYNCLDTSDDLCLTLIQEEFVTALTTASQLLLKKGDYKGLDEYFHILHIILCHQESADPIAKLASRISSVLIPYLLKCDDDMVLSQGRTGALAAAVSTFSHLSANHGMKQSQELELWLNNMLGVVENVTMNGTEDRGDASERGIQLDILTQELRKLQSTVASSSNSVPK